MSSKQTLLRGTSIVSILTLVSRILGLVRDIVFSRVFGAGLVSDAFFVAFRVPNILRSLVAEGALTSAFVPVFATELENSPEHAQTALRSVMGLLLLTTSILSLLGILFAEQIVAVIGVGFTANSDKALLCTQLTRIMLPYILFVSLVAMFNGALNTLKIFGFGQVAQIAMNVTLIAGALIAWNFDPRRGIFVLAGFVLLGGILQIAALVPGLRRGKIVLLPGAQLLTPASRQVLILIVPAVLGAAVYQLQMLMNTVFASLLKEGSVSWLFYADRLAQLPIGVFSIALASVLLPTLSSAAAANNRGEFNSGLANALRYTSFVIIPVAFGLHFYAEAVIRLIFEGGAFSGEASAQSARAVQALCFGLWSISCHSMLTRAYLAKKDPLTPSLVGLAGLFINAMAALALMGPSTVVPESSFAEVIVHTQGFIPANLSLSLGHVGLALASVISSLATFLILIFLLPGKNVKLALSGFLRAAVKALVAGTLMYTALLGWSQIVHSPLLNLLTGAPLGVFTYALASILLKNSEAQETISHLRRLRR